MQTKNNRNAVLRLCSVAAVGVFGSVLAFLVGARIGSGLDHQTRTVSVARMPIPVTQTADEELPAAPSEVARK